LYSDLLAQLIQLADGEMTQEEFSQYLAFRGHCDPQFRKG
jgi:hypothetical protein